QKKKRYFKMETVGIKIAFQLIDLLCYCIFFKVILDPVIDSLCIAGSMRIKTAIFLFIVISGVSVILKSIDFYNALDGVT
ncbi:hypothetical protein, partial [Aquimarina algiphila]